MAMKNHNEYKSEENLNYLKSHCKNYQRVMDECIKKIQEKRHRKNKECAYYKYQRVTVLEYFKFNMKRQKMCC